MGGVNIPAEVVDAHRSGDLVLFVGAGASKDSPANLPDFVGLTGSIAEKAYLPVDEFVGIPCDIALGRIKSRGVDVHQLVAAELADPSSTYNRLHEAIVDLGRAGRDLRIVTTNFDRHLTSVIEARGIEVDECAAPALPVGNDFAGIVYLHGTLTRPADRLVVTDEDFGRAYLRDAWAARFLERMFAKFIVLFIGYSHDDVVMRYLARSLGPDGHRYVLTATPDAADWTELGLRPIGYELDGDSHRELGNAISRWAEISAMGLLDHRQRVSDLVAAPPSGIPEDDSYLEEVIADPDRVKFFCESARGPDWLAWASDHGTLKRLFGEGSERAELDQPLASWFVERFVMAEEHTTTALELVEGHRVLGAQLWHEIGFHLHRRDTPRPAWLNPWLVLMIRDAPPWSSHWLDFAFTASSWPDDRELALLLFDHLTEPTVRVISSYGLGGAQLEVRVRGDDYWLVQGWEQVIRPNLAEAAHDIAAIVDRHLRRLRQLQVGGRHERRDWDAVSFSRNAIEPHSQDTYREPIDVLIDAARDVLEALLDESDPAAAGYLHSWAGADSEILRRLAIHGWTHRDDVDASTKIEWVIGTGWLLDSPVRHELFRLIAEALPEASDEAVAALAAQALERDDDEVEYMAYEHYNALVWMSRHRPGDPVITAALEEAHAVDPDWLERPDPDLTHSIEAGFVEPRPPMSIAEFHHQLTSDFTRLFRELHRYHGVERWNGGPTWSDALALVTDAVSAEPADGLVILGDESIGDDVIRAVISGLSRARLSPEAAADVIAHLAELDRSAFTWDLAHLLSAGGRSERHPTDWTGLPGARQLATELWGWIDTSEILSEATDWLNRAINHPGGQLAEFWLEVVRHDWREADDAWNGLIPEHRLALEMMLSSQPETMATRMAETICVGRLSFLFAADPAWTESNVLPLLSWSEPARARRCWNTFTRWGRWNDGMLDAGLMESYLEAVPHIHEFEAEQPHFLGHLASISLSSVRDPMGWLPPVIAQLGNDDRVRLAEQVAEDLRSLPPDAVEHEWARWMQAYWTQRLQSLPTQLSFEECTAMAGWVPFLSGSFEEGVDLVLQRPARFVEHDSVLRQLAPRADSAPDACAQMIGHLMMHTVLPWWGAHDLPPIWPKLVAESDPEHIQVITEQSIRLGLGDPNDWRLPG